VLFRNTASCENHTERTIKTPRDQDCYNDGSRQPVSSSEKEIVIHVTYQMIIHELLACATLPVSGTAEVMSQTVVK
jgi:hypothetical protein